MKTTFRGNWLAGNLLVAAFLVPVVIVHGERLLASWDGAPVYVMLETPVTQTPVVREGDAVVVRWVGYYRKDCPRLRYGRTLIRTLPSGEEIEALKVLRPASSAKRTDPKPSAWSWTPNTKMPPGNYLWRTIEHAECVDGVTHVATLHDAPFTVVE